MTMMTLILELLFTIEYNWVLFSSECVTTEWCSMKHGRTEEGVSGRQGPLARARQTPACTLLAEPSALVWGGTVWRTGHAFLICI